MAAIREENKHSPALNSKLIAHFLSLRKRFRPVMRHFFTEKHKTPMSWFAMRLNYTRSVATTSIVGHILGLGDRHTSNILLDSSTGEVVHIDLGIAFEQVRLTSFLLHASAFNSPHRTASHHTGQASPDPGVRAVPHDGRHGRRDGHDGHTRRLPALRRRNATRAARGLRGDPDRARSIQIRPAAFLVRLAFHHLERSPRADTDALHCRTASEFKIKRAQGSPSTDVSRGPTPGPGGAPGLDMSSGTADESADRALTAVARKLDRALSTEYTVNELIAEATDPANLACMFIGGLATVPSQAIRFPLTCVICRLEPTSVVSTEPLHFILLTTSSLLCFAFFFGILSHCSSTNSIISNATHYIEREHPCSETCPLQSYHIDCLKLSQPSHTF
jgi:ataxia telangiectasia mutated family protein